MNAIDDLGERIRRVRRDALLIEAVLLVAGIAFLICAARAGDPGIYAVGWGVLLALTLLVPQIAHALLPFAVLTWWFGGAQVGSALSLPAAWSLLVIFTCVALLTAGPDGVPLARVVVVRYAQRTGVVAGLTTLVWAASRLLPQARGTTVIVTVAGFAAVAMCVIALPALVHPTGRADRES